MTFFKGYLYDNVCTVYSLAMIAIMFPKTQGIKWHIADFYPKWTT